MIDDIGGVVSMFMKKGIKIDLFVLGVCIVIGSCGVLERVISEEVIGKGVCGVVRRDDIKGWFIGTGVGSVWRIFKIEVVKIFIDKVGNDEELGGIFVWFFEREVDVGRVELIGIFVVEFVDLVILK